MHIGGSPTLGSDAFGEHSSIMKEPLSALCFLVMIQNLNLMISWHFELIKHNSKQVHIQDTCKYPRFVLFWTDDCFRRTQASWGYFLKLNYLTKDENMQISFENPPKSLILQCLSAESSPSDVQARKQNVNNWNNKTPGPFAHKGPRYNFGRIYRKSQILCLLHGLCVHHCTSRKYARTRTNFHIISSDVMSLMASGYIFVHLGFKYRYGKSQDWFLRFYVARFEALPA